jgi:ADP-ribose pyrophosphatase YjhB (NUDIX family)
VPESVGQPLTRTTIGAGGLVVRGESLLMVRQTRATGTRWEVPGGGQEPGESLEETVAREVAEEAAIAVTAVRLICTYASFREPERTAVLGAFFLAVEVDDSAVPTPQTSDGILEAAFLDPAKLEPDELGALSGAVLARWWPRRSEELPTFHVNVWRSPSGYRLG